MTTLDCRKDLKVVAEEADRHGVFAVADATKRRCQSGRARRDDGIGSLTPATPIKHRARRSAALALAGYGCASVALFHAGLTGRGGTTVSPSGDTEVFVWWLNWFPTSFELGQSPIASDYMYASGGVNAMWCTSVLLLGLILWPITKLAGPLASYNVAMVLSLPISAWAAYFAARKLVSRGPAFIAGLVYGFSPFMAHHAWGHLNLTTQALGPIVLILVHRIVVGHGSSRVNGALIGGAFALNTLVSEDTVAVVGLSLITTLGILVVRRYRVSPALAASSLSIARPAMLSAALVGGLLVAPVIAYQLFGPSALGSVGVQPDAYVIDLANFVVPTDLELVSPPFADRLAARFNAEGPSEQTGYFGMVLLVVVGAVIRRHWRGRAEVRALGILFGVSALLSLGPLLKVAGQRISVPLPAAVLATLPITSDVVLARFTLVAWLAAALLLGIWVDSTTTGASRRRKAAVWCSVLVILGSLLPRPIPAGDLNAPPFFTSDEVSRLPNHRPTIVTPVGYHQTVPMAWQVASDMSFKLIGGNAYAPGRFDPGGWYLSTLHRVTAEAENGDRVHARDLDAARHDLEMLGVGAVVVGPSANQSALVHLYRELLCRDPSHLDNSYVWYDLDGTSSC